MKTFIGIDPGKKGAIAIIRPDGKVAMTTFEESGELGYRDVLAGLDRDNTICCLEQVHSFPHDSNKVAFAFGENFGFIQGLLVANRIPYQLEGPKKWKKEYSLGNDKSESIREAHRLFPDVSLRRTERCKTDHDGMAEALLMAEYARRKL